MKRLRWRDKLGDVVPLTLVRFPSLDESLAFGVAGGDDAGSDGSCATQAQVGESFAELLKLSFDLLLADALLGQLFSVFCG